MTLPTLRRWWPATAVFLAASTPAAHADEGMWLPDRPPLAMLEERYGFSPDREWLEHLQKAAVRLSDGGSGSIVSADGLVMTNHHVAAGQVAKLSTAEKDYAADGFLATSRDQELRVPDLEILALWEIEDVSERVKEAAAGKSAAEAASARRAAIAAIESESIDTTGLHSEIVTLYGGGLFHLYRYKRYTDVRLVFAPENAIGFYGGDVDNFEFPRHNLDVAFLRLYENDAPVRAEHYLSFTTDGLTEGDLVIMAGHPGSTQRGFTVEHLRFLRDVAYPSRMASIYRREVELRTFSDESDEHRRIAARILISVQNSRKALGGKLLALQDPAVFTLKLEEEAGLRDAVAADPEATARWGDAWDRIAAAQEVYREIYERYTTMRSLRRSQLFRLAQTIVRRVAETAKPSGERLREFRDSALPSLDLRLYSKAPIYADLERDQLMSCLRELADDLGSDDPIVVKALAGMGPAERARDLVTGSELFDPEARRALVEGGAEAIAASEDPVIELALILDDDFRTLRRRKEEEVDGVERQAYDGLAAARFAVYGENVYPDATFTLRLSFGQVMGFEQAGEQVAPFTTVGGIYERTEERGGAFPFALPERWQERRESLDLSTPFNFVSTNDIIGGNSGSPAVNRRGEIVGIVFDGNRYSFAWDTIFSQVRGRSLSVDARAIVEILRGVYGADALLAELLPTSE